MDDAIRWLRISFWVGAIVDAGAALQMLHPRLFAFTMRPVRFEPGNDYGYAMGMGASLMIGWTALLLWADRRPLERKEVLPLTVVPVIAGLALNQLVAVRNGFVRIAAVAPIWGLQLGLALLFIGSYLKALRTEPPGSAISPRR